MSDSGLGQSEFSGVDYTRRSETSDDAEQSLLPSDHAGIVIVSHYIYIYIYIYILYYID